MTTATAFARASVAGDADAIRTICTTAYWATYRGLVAPDYLERAIAEYYNAERIAREVAAAPPRWHGYQVVEEGGLVLGAAGGGITSPGTGELFVIYLDPEARNRGLGTLLLDRVTSLLRDGGATEMWVSVVDGNEKGLPFYRARGFTPVERRRAWGSTENDDVWTWRMRRDI